MEKTSLRHGQAPYTRTFNGKVGVFDSLSDIDEAIASQFDGLCSMVCTNGKFACEIDGNAVDGAKDDLIACVMPGTVFGNWRLSDDFRFCGIFMSKEYTMNISPLIPNGWNLMHFFDKRPKLHLASGEVDNYRRYYELLKDKIAEPGRIYNDRVVDALIVAFVYGFHGVISRFTKLPVRTLSSAEDIFDKFTTTLQSSYPKQRSVAYYAKRMNITPKYLSVVCKKAVGYTATKIIDIYVTKDIERLLKNTHSSAKEIAYELGFPNTSFFSRYVKKNLGCTPKEYRLRTAKGGNGKEAKPE